MLLDNLAHLKALKMRGVVAALTLYVPINASLYRDIQMSKTVTPWKFSFNIILLSQLAHFVEKSGGRWGKMINFGGSFHLIEKNAVLG